MIVNLTEQRVTGTRYGRITDVAPGILPDRVASAFHGWQAVKIGTQTGYPRSAAKLQRNNAADPQSGSYEPDCGPLFLSIKKSENNFLL